MSETENTPDTEAAAAAATDDESAGSAAPDAAADDKLTRADFRRRRQPPRRRRAAPAEVVPPKERRAQGRLRRPPRAERGPRTAEERQAERVAGPRKATERRALSGRGRGPRQRPRRHRHGDRATRARAGCAEDPPGRRRVGQGRQDDHGADDVSAAIAATTRSCGRRVRCTLTTSATTRMSATRCRARGPSAVADEALAARRECGEGR